MDVHIVVSGICLPRQGRTDGEILACQFLGGSSVTSSEEGQADAGGRRTGCACSGRVEMGGILGCETVYTGERHDV